MNTNPLVSVIIPCYNYARFLPEALDSIINQTYSNWECIVVNDGSSDNTEEVALKYVSADSRIKYFYKENSGQWASRNLALQKLKGEYIQYLDADDMLQPAKLELQVSLLNEHQDIDAVYGDILKFEDNGQKEREFVLYHQPEKFPETGRGKDMIDALMLDNFFLPGCVLMRTNVFTRLGEGFKKAYGLEDWELWFRMAAIDCNFYHDNREGTRLLTRHHGSNVSSKPKKMLADRLNVRKEILNSFIQFSRQGRLNFDAAFVKNVIRRHQILIAKEFTAYHLEYGNVLTGAMVGVPKHAYYSGRPFYAVYDGAHYLKERVKARFKKK